MFYEKDSFIGSRSRVKFLFMLLNKITIGSIDQDEELVHVASERNVHFLMGQLLPMRKQRVMFLM